MDRDGRWGFEDGGEGHVGVVTVSLVSDVGDFSVGCGEWGCRIGILDFLHEIDGISFLGTLICTSRFSN